MDLLRTSDISVTVQIGLGSYIDNTAADDVESITGRFLEMSNIKQAIDSNYVMTHELATFEGPGIPTAVAAGIIAPPIQAVDYPPEAGVWSADISDADGNMEWPITIQLTQPHTSAFTVYTDGPRILRGRFQYYNGEELIRDVTVDSTSETFADTEPTTYDKLVITILRIDEAYHHVRVVEVEFGASVTISNETVGETIDVIMERDILGTTMPINEISFSLLNVEGEYDPDNPATKLKDVPMWNPLELSFSVIHRDTQITIPMGTYYITDRKGTDTLLQITAQDARAILSNLVQSLTLSAATSMGDTIEDLFTDLQIPYVIDDAVYQVMPDRDATIGGDDRTTLLQAFLYIEQYYGVSLTPGRDGYLHVSKDWTGDESHGLTADLLMSYPTASSTKTYNGISIKYGEGTSKSTYEVDLRTSETEAKSVLSINNPLIVDEENAKRVCQMIQSRLYTQQYEAESVADAALDPGDTVRIDGQFSMDDPDTYRISSIEISFDGGFTMQVKGVRL